NFVAPNASAPSRIAFGTAFIASSDIDAIIGLVMGVMIIPMIASTSEDAMNAVPNAMREGALALGATKLETTFRVVIPAALSGIIVSIVLAISRAIGETMIVTIASGSTKNFTYDITQSMQTMTA